MQQRIAEELSLLRTRYPGLEYLENGQWAKISDYPVADGWNPRSTPVVFQILPGHPGTPPYGFYVPVGLRYQGATPNNYTEPAKQQPPFDGTWGLFSWQPSEWRPAADVRSGANLLNWVLGFATRFREGV
jgi:hypothetical protein